VLEAFRAEIAELCGADVCRDVPHGAR